MVASSIASSPCAFVTPLGKGVVDVDAFRRSCTGLMTAVSASLRPIERGDQLPVGGTGGVEFAFALF